MSMSRTMRSRVVGTKARGAMALACLSVILSNLACDVLKADQSADGGSLDPGRATPGAGGTGDTEVIPGDGGSSGSPAAGAPPSISGAITPAEATPDCPVPIKAPAIGTAVVGRVCSKNAANTCQPISGALVGYYVKDIAPVCLRGRTMTGPDGRFRIAGIEPASFSTYALVVMAAGHLQAAASGFGTREGREEDLYDVNLARAAEGAPPSSLHRATIAGRVCGRDGVNSCVPLVGALVGYRLSEDTAATIITEVRADKDGRFNFPGIEPAIFGHFTVSVTANGHDQNSVRVGSAYPGDSVDVDDVNLDDAAQGVESQDLLSATISGTVCMVSNLGCAPVPGASVSLLDAAEAAVVKTARSDAKGRFGFAGIKPEVRAFIVSCQAPDAGAQKTTTFYGVRAGETATGECRLGP
jgi:protocatechuate 3,4-dioxygenase beta subunit